ncbi:MAG: competence/damage-inducible protein A [Alphaproteobacteria bacterium]|nr:competence/damage-inducible protein A [Alphaproteobacteria bacterium]
MKPDDRASNDAPRDAAVSACLIIIGNEILSGRTQDKNLSYAAKWLNQNGIQLREVRVIPDVEDAIVESVNDCRRRFDYVFTTGGIGPTHDDITAASIARAFGVPIERNEAARKLLEEQYIPGDLTEARLKMADIPAGAQLIENPISKAPGFQIDNVFVMAGVPAIMQAMLDSVQHRLVGGTPVASRQIACFLAEGRVAHGLAAVQERFPHIDIGSYPFWKMRKFGVSVVLRGTDEASLAAATEAVRSLIRDLGGDPHDEAVG